MLKNRSFVLATVIASATTAFAAAPSFAAPIAIATTRQPDREPPVVERHDRQAAPTSDEAATAPITTAVKSGFATAPIATDGVFGFGVHASVADVANTRSGFARAGATTKSGFASVR